MPAISNVTKKDPIKVPVIPEPLPYPSLITEVINFTHSTTFSVQDGLEIYAMLIEPGIATIVTLQGGVETKIPLTKGVPTLPIKGVSEITFEGFLSAPTTIAIGVVAIS
jgi:hypothetical protein